MRHLLVISALTLGLSSPCWAQEEREDKAFIGVRAVDLEFRTSHATREDNMAGAELVLGSHITDYVRVELRLGTGLGDIQLEEELTAEVKGYASWYMGPQYPITENLWVYGLLGFSFIKGDTERADPDSYPEYPDKFYDSSFSFSYAAGFDYRLFGNWYGNFEFGRINRDSQTKLRTMQLGLGIKYEF